MSGSGFAKPSAVVECVLELFECDCGFETSSGLDEVFANERVVECGFVMGNEGVFHCSGLGGCILDGDYNGDEPVVVVVMVPPS